MTNINVSKSGHWRGCEDQTGSRTGYPCYFELKSKFNNMILYTRSESSLTGLAENSEDIILGCLLLSTCLRSSVNSSFIASLHADSLARTSRYNVVGAPYHLDLVYTETSLISDALNRSFLVLLGPKCSFSLPRLTRHCVWHAQIKHAENADLSSLSSASVGLHCHRNSPRLLYVGCHIYVLP